MTLFASPKQPEDVFTPRASMVNPAMYIARPDLEESLRRNALGSLHVLIHGESGSGKSWLYKSVFMQMGAHYFSANLANASRLGSITSELKNAVDRTGTPQQVGYSAT